MKNNKSNILLLNVLEYEHEIKYKFNELKLLTGCEESYLNDLYKEAKTKSINILDLINIKIYDYQNIYNETLAGQCEQLRNLLNKKSIIESIIESLQLNKFIDWLENLLERKLRKYER